MILFLLGCAGQDYALTGGGNYSCPDVYLSCPEPVINISSDTIDIECPELTCPNPFVEVVIESDCPSLECPDVTCPTPMTEVVVNNDVDTQPIADELSLSLSNSIDQKEYYAESVSVPVDGTVDFTNNSTTTFKNQIY